MGPRTRSSFYGCVAPRTNGTSFRRGKSFHASLTSCSFWSATTANDTRKFHGIRTIVRKSFDWWCGCACARIPPHHHSPRVTKYRYDSGRRPLFGDQCPNYPHITPLQSHPMNDSCLWWWKIEPKNRRYTTILPLITVSNLVLVVRLISSRMVVVLQTFLAVNLTLWRFLFLSSSNNFTFLSSTSSFLIPSHSACTLISYLTHTLGLNKLNYTVSLNK